MHTATTIDYAITLRQRHQPINFTSAALLPSHFIRHILHLYQILHLTNAAGDSEALPSAEEAISGTLAKTTLGKACPELASVAATSKGLVCVEDGITSLGHSWGAGLQSHAVHDELHGKEASVGGDAVVKLRHAFALVAMLIDEVPEDFIEDRAPDITNSVDARLLVCLCIRVRVDGHVGSVGVLSDSVGSVADPVTKPVDSGAVLAGLCGISNGHEVTPTFSHAARFRGTKAVRVGRSTSQASTH